MGGSMPVPRSWANDAAIAMSTPQSTEARATAAVMHLVPSSSPAATRAAASIDVYPPVTTSTMPVRIIDSSH